MENSAPDQFDDQINHLIHNAPDLATAEAIEVIAPILKQVAAMQTQSKYFLLLAPTGDLVVTTLGQIGHREITKTIVYAYPSREIAAQNSQDLTDSVIKEFEITSLLFWLLGAPTIESLILDDHPIQEIIRQELYNLCQNQLKISRIA